MTPEEVAETIEETQRLLRDAGIQPDSALGVAAFPAVFTALRTERTVVAPTEELRREAPTETVGGPLRRTAEWLDVEPEIVADLLDFTDDRVQIHLNLSRIPESNAATQRLLAYVYLGSVRAAFGMTEVNSRDLNEILDAYGVLDQNVWTNLERATPDNAFSRRGDRGGHVYRLSVPGFHRAREIIRDLLDAAQ